VSLIDSFAIHPDRITKRVVNEEMIEQITARFTSLKMLLRGFKEWHELAVHKENGEEELWTEKLD
jgi:hypothetical protein